MIKSLISQNIRIRISLQFKCLFIIPSQIVYSKTKIAQRSRQHRIQIIRSYTKRFKKIAKELRDIANEIKKIKPRNKDQNPLIQYKNKKELKKQLKI